MNASIVTAQADVNNMTDGPITFAINGMSCAGCASSAEKALNGLDGIGTASVDFATERAQVSPGGVSAAALVQAVKDAGYTPETSWVDLDITGMTCSGCAASVERALENVPGVADAEVNLALERARVTWLGHDVATAALVDAVKVAGDGAQAGCVDIGRRDHRHGAACGDDGAACLRRRLSRAGVGADGVGNAGTIYRGRTVLCGGVAGGEGAIREHGSVGGAGYVGGVCAVGLDDVEPRHQCSGAFVF